MRHLQPRLISLDAMVPVVAVLLTMVVADRAVDFGGRAAATPVVALLFVFTVVVLTVTAPHVLVAATIPIFAAIPMLKVLVVPWIGPLKDAITIAAAIGIAVLVVRRRAAGDHQRGDHIALGLAAAFLGLYMVNLGGGFGPSAYDGGWMQGVRLAAEPILLLAIGLMSSQPRKTYEWAMRSLIVTAVACALIGLYQQRVGVWALADMGYEFDRHIRTINGRLRSFGSLDDSFAYAAFLLFGLAAVAFHVRRRVVAAGAGAVLLAGITVGYVRTSVVMVVAIAGLWLARKGRTQVAVLVLAASAVAAVAILVQFSEGSESHVVRADQNTYLTINGRTDVWRNVLGGPKDWLIGRGVGEVGTAADRATFGVYQTASEAQEDLGTAVDSGYLATIADTGLIGLVVLLVLFARLAMLSVLAIRAGRSCGWVAAALLTVILLDAVTRASFNGFPTAFLGLLLVGLALNAAEDEERRERAAASA